MSSEYLNQSGVELFVLSRASTGTGILPVNVQTIKLILPQELNHRLDESLAGSRGGHHS